MPQTPQSKNRDRSPIRRLAEGVLRLARDLAERFRPPAPQVLVPVPVRVRNKR